MDNKKVFGVAVKAVVKKDDRYLILKKSDLEDINPNTYDLPGGRIEFGEKLEEAVVREVAEETGLDVKPKTVFNAWTFIKDDYFQLTGVDFLCEFVGGKQNLSEEHEEILWLTCKQVKNRADFPEWLIKTIDKAEGCLMS